MPSQLEKARDLLIIATGIVGIVTGIVGSAFALYKYKKGREAQAILRLELELSVHNIATENLVDISIHVKDARSLWEVKHEVCSVRERRTRRGYTDG